MNYQYTTTETRMTIAYEVGASIAQRVTDLIDQELKLQNPRADKLRDLSECLRSTLDITGPEKTEDTTKEEK